MTRVCLLMVAILTWLATSAIQAEGTIITDGGCTCRACFPYKGSFWQFTNLDATKSWCYVNSQCGTRGNAGYWDYITAANGTAEYCGKITTARKCTCKSCFDYNGRYRYTKSDNNGVAWCYVTSNCGSQGTGGYWDNIAYSSALSSSESCDGEPKFYNIAHMANSPAAVDWALDVAGANAVEVDLRFDGLNMPAYFNRGEIPTCECLCILGSGYSLMPFSTMIAHLAQKPTLALVYIDTKLDFDHNNMFTAGKNVFNGVKQMYALGYRGRVVIAVESMKYEDYLRGYAHAAATTPQDPDPLKRPVSYYAYDRDNSAPSALYTNLSAFAPYPYYAYGWCTRNPKSLSPESVEGNILQAAGSLAGPFKGAIALSLESESSMLKYMNAGATSVTTYWPESLYNLAVEKGFYDEQNPGKWDPAPCKADCSHSAGGCRITVAARPGCLTRCVYYDLTWTCSGVAVSCKAEQTPWCFATENRNSSASCRAGGGDCGGY